MFKRAGVILSLASIWGLIGLGWAYAIAPPPVSIRVSPRALFVGNGVRLVCRVEPHTDNRSLRWGFRFWTESRRDLEGLNAPITTQQIYNRVPCNPGEAFCQVVRANGHTFYAALDVQVEGCDGNTFED